MPEPDTRPAPRKRRMPILGRHAISLAVIFALALPLSLLIGQRVYRSMQLDKLDAADEATFAQGLAYVAAHAGEDAYVADSAYERSAKLPPQRAASLLLAVGVAQPANAAVPGPVYEHAGAVIARMPVAQAMGFYGALLELPGSDPALVERALLDHLQASTEADLILAADLLDQELLWSKAKAPRGLWLRWLELLAGSSAEGSQAKAALLLAEQPEDADDPRVAGMLLRLATSVHDPVREQALDIAAGFAAIAKDPTDFEQVVFTLGSDTNPAIARRAWMVVGHLNPVSGFAVQWKDADPAVAEAMLWAAIKTNPQNTRPALDALKTPGYEAAGALSVSHRADVPVTDEELVLKALIQAQPANDRAVVWRSILASREYSNSAASIIEPYGHSPVPDDASAALYLAGTWVRGGPMPERDPGNPYSDFELIAYLEGLIDHGQGDHALWSKQFEIGDDWPALPRLLAAMLKPDAQAGIGPEALREADTTGRDLILVAATVNTPLHTELAQALRSNIDSVTPYCALLAAIKGDRPTLIDGVTADLLRRRPDLTTDMIRAMSDTELAELGLRRVDAIKALLEAAQAAPDSIEQTSRVRLLQLALWTRGDLGDDFTPSAEAMLFDDDLPTSTVLMCLLHRKRPAALDYLFAPRGAAAPRLHDLFIQQRWWHVFRRFVDTTDLTLWLWGDAAAQAFQLDAMRAWYAVNRYKIERGDWPAPGKLAGE